MFCHTHQHGLKAALCIAAALPVVAYGDEALLRFRAESSVLTGEIRLGDVSTVSLGDEHTAAAMKEVIIGESAPPGYSRFVTPSEIVRYYLAPHFPDVSFRIADDRRISVTTLGKSIKIIDIEQNIRSYITQQLKWERDNYTVRIVARKGTEITCYDAPYSLEISGLTSGYAKGSLRLTVHIMQKEKTFRMTVPVKIEVTAPVVVAKQPIPRGSELSEHNTELAHRDVTYCSYVCYSGIDQICNKIAIRSLKAGTIIHEKHVKAKPLIERGEMVRIRVRKGPVSVSVTGTAKENGLAGQLIWVQNNKSGKLLQAEVVTRGTVRLPISEEAI
ncbi:MAG: flagellar basal body P-ring formation protein FlgA [Chitinivibrionales bacterium]|nr:flagellar basal body P-ring formation protein FlgA [Chitinivibrionales bacterium]